MEKLRPWLLRTYAGPASRRGARRGGGGGAAGGLRLRRQPLPWISPQVDPRLFFSTSSSAGGSSASLSVSSTPSDDSDFLPPKRQLKRQPKAKPRGRKGGKENRAPKAGRKAGGGSPTTSNKSARTDSVVPPTPLRRNITLRPQRQGHPRDNWRETPSLAKPCEGLWGRPPLLCSTPEQCHLPPLANEDLLEEEASVLQSSNALISCSPYNCNRQQQLVLKENSYAPHDVLPELSLFNMDEDTDSLGGSLELFTQEDSKGPQQKSASEAPQRQLPPGPVPQWHLSQSRRTSLQSHFVLRCPNARSETEASSENWEGLTTSPGDPALSPHQLHCHPLQEVEKDCQLPSSPKTNNAPLSVPRGALQLQAIMCNGKIALSLPKDETPLTKRQQISVEGGPTPEKKAANLNGTLSDEGSNFSIDQSSPHLQPVVVLDSQVVPDWLASQSTRKQAASHLLQKNEYDLQQDSFCSRPRNFDTKCNSQVVLTCGPGSTARKACISGFSTSRWAKQGKLGQVRHKKNMKKQQQTDASFLQQHLKWNEMENDIALSFLSPDCSLLKNSTLWRRIRASFSLHKKKKILSEAESFNSSASAQSSLAETPRTPFTQKLGYSICPASSMVLLSAMKSSSKAEIILTDKEKVYGECQQVGPISFEECIPPEKMQKCEKIGEGVFGEVFRTDGERGTVALKIIPIEGSDKVNGEPQKTFSEILPEIIISKELSLLAEEKDNQTSGFISLYSVHCVQGAYPECLLKAWDEYNRLRESENDRPDFFGNQQLFMILEFEFGGTDLENMRNRQLNSVAMTKSILSQITASLAVAEEALHFEHRDLHWGNVLVKKTHLKELNFMLNGETHSVTTQGILVNIIDYTFSRLEKDGLTVYCDLSSDEEVFQGRGDYQFDIYRQMREENANNWADYFPHSNILWLHYLADKLLKAMTYKKKPTTSSTRQAQKQLELFLNEVLGFKSARDLFNKSTFFH